MEPTPPPSSFLSWVTQPQTLIALSAIVLSLCGLFISVYEANLIRQSQQAAVWPYVEVSATLGQRVELRVQNVGVGPARIEAASVTKDGEPVADWRTLVGSVGGASADSISGGYASQISNRVLPAGESETIFRLRGEESLANRELVRGLRTALFKGEVDVSVCYCSVYDACWTASLQDLIGVSARNQPASGNQPVATCDDAPRSQI
ncbi:MAG: hypothetical protein AAGJ10_05275 [Bacteroidota bacterium]